MSARLHDCLFLRSFPQCFSRRAHGPKTVTPFRATVRHHVPNHRRSFLARRSVASDDALPIEYPTAYGTPPEMLGWGHGSDVIGTASGRPTSPGAGSCELITRRERRMIVCSWLSMITTVFVLFGIGIDCPIRFCRPYKSLNQRFALNVSEIIVLTRRLNHDPTAAFLERLSPPVVRRAGRHPLRHAVLLPLPGASQS